MYTYIFSLYPQPNVYAICESNLIASDVIEYFCGRKQSETSCGKWESCEATCDTATVVACGNGQAKLGNGECDCNITTGEASSMAQMNCPQLNWGKDFVNDMKMLPQSLKKTVGGAVSLLTEGGDCVAIGERGLLINNELAISNDELKGSKNWIATVSTKPRNDGINTLSLNKDNSS